jgi:hypothetical protein
VYITWAALDNFKQTTMERISIEVMACATGVSAWGFWYLLLVQFLLRIRTEGESNLGRRAMCTMTLLASVVPFFKIIIAMYRVSTFVDLGIHAIRKKAAFRRVSSDLSRAGVWWNYALYVTMGQCAFPYT